MADDPTKVVALHGVGLLSETLPDGRSCRHYGGVFRFKGPAENPEAAKAFVEGPWRAWKRFGTVAIARRPGHWK
jgi:hypothetical protein